MHRLSPDRGRTPSQRDCARISSANDRPEPPIRSGPAPMPEPWASWPSYTDVRYTTARPLSERR